MTTAKDELNKLETEIRADFDALQTKVAQLEKSRLISSAITKLDEAYHWVRDHFESKHDSLAKQSPVSETDAQ